MCACADACAVGTLYTLSAPSSAWPRNTCTPAPAVRGVPHVSGTALHAASWGMAPARLSMRPREAWTCPSRAHVAGNEQCCQALRAWSCLVPPRLPG